MDSKYTFLTQAKEFSKPLTFPLFSSCFFLFFLPEGFEVGKLSSLKVTSAFVNSYFKSMKKKETILMRLNSHRTSRITFPVGNTMAIMIGTVPACFINSIRIEKENIERPFLQHFRLAKRKENFLTSSGDMQQVQNPLQNF